MFAKKSGHGHYVDFLEVKIFFCSTQHSHRCEENSGSIHVWISVSTYDLRADIPCILSGQWQKKIHVAHLRHYRLVNPKLTGLRQGRRTNCINQVILCGILSMSLQLWKNVRPQKNALGKQIKQTTTSNLGIGNTKSQLVTENMFPTTLMYVSCMDLFTIYQSTNLIVYRIPTYGINGHVICFFWLAIGWIFLYTLNSLKHP